MKKENRKMAQERRAKERRKKELRRKISKGIVIGVPSLAAIILIIAIVVSAFTSDSASESDSANSSDSSSADSSSGSSDTEGSQGTDSTDSEEETDSEAASAEYSTDTSLTVEDGDTVNIDYVGSVDGVEFDGGSTNGAGTDLVIGSGSYIDDFEEQLIGYHPGDQVDVYVTFPDDYSNNPDLSGAEALFEVTINGIYK
ncbi:FKBP-type peptidyl-prolyl cis-trans isomerase [Ruminococcus sp. CLA-AA-H200]|uniref:Peptidyl-prolyl cis-trans isomerase n=1 Tax=Ruminococcus turbiniformis TaxID=2881258 RepID=A0ABS8FV99_9FIRM|nr:FKBP-type peptidyl-prolyl cis-trans isomerase [Ruminococcus turbiniformis]MCC2253549.1 FKBP-type peptidyl-prolyl cis-trans isomerase [Ruminococcus turbiniformis]